MSKIPLLIQFSRRLPSLPPRLGLELLFPVSNLRTCYKQKKWKALCWIDQEIRAKLTEEEEREIKNQVLQTIHTQPSFANELKFLILLHGEAKSYFSLEEVAEILGCSAFCLEKDIQNREFPAPEKEGYSQELLWNCLLIFFRNSGSKSTNNIKNAMAALCLALNKEISQSQENSRIREDEPCPESETSEVTVEVESIKAAEEENFLSAIKKNDFDFLNKHFYSLTSRGKRNKRIRIRAPPTLSTQ